MDPGLLYPLAAEMIRRYGGDMIEVGEGLAEKILEKGEDAIAAGAVGALVAWLRARAKRPEALEEKAQAAILHSSDEEALAALADEIEEVAGGAIPELQALVETARAAASVSVTGIRFGGIKSAVYVEGGGSAHIGRLDVDIR